MTKPLLDLKSMIIFFFLLLAWAIPWAVGIMVIFIKLFGKG